MNERRDMRSLFTFAVAALVGTVSLAPSARATTITGPLALNFTNGTGNLVGATVTTTTPSGSLGNALTLTEDIQTSSGLGVRADFTFALVGGPAGSTQYLVTETVINHTGSIWNGFQIFMGCDFGFTPCSPSGAGPVNVDYSLVATPTASVPATLDLTLPYLLQWNGMSVGNGQQVQFTFGVKTFDCGPGACSGSWDIGSQPNVPEPGTLVLTLFGVFLLMAGGRQWHR